jgi:hypothetical protein
MEESLILGGLQTRSPIQCLKQDTMTWMKIRAHLRDLNVYRNLERPLQFSENIWNAFYQSKVQLKASRQLKEITEQLAKAKKAREFRRSDHDLKAMELKLAECQ